MTSFRIRLVLWYTFVALVTLVIFRFATVQVIRDSLYAELDESLEGEMKWLKGMLASLRLRNLPDEEIRGEILERSRFSPRKEFLEIYDIEGREYFRSPNLEIGDTLRVLRLIPMTDSTVIQQPPGHHLRMISSVDADAEMYIAYPLTDIDAAVEKIISSFIFLIPGATILLIVGGLFLVTRFMKPVKQLRRYAADLIDRPLDKELTAVTVGVKDEMGLLIEQINEMGRRMRTSMRQVLGFSSLASHELRTPLAVMRNQLEEALQVGAARNDLQERLSSTYDEILRLTRIVDDFLSLSTMQAGTFKLNRARISFDRMLDEFCDEAEALGEQKMITLQRRLAPDVFVDVDVKRFRHVLFNLLDNALRHTQEGGTLGIEMSIRGNRAIVRFSDSGSGIPVEELPYIFDPFRRIGTSSPKSDNTGLGLALVRWIVEAHGGTVSVERTGSSGTVFSLSLPMAT